MIRLAGNVDNRSWCSFDFQDGTAVPEARVIRPYDLDTSDDHSASAIGFRFLPSVGTWLAMSPFAHKRHDAVQLNAGGIRCDSARVISGTHPTIRFLQEPLPGIRCLTVRDACILSTVSLWHNGFFRALILACIDEHDEDEKY